MDEKVTKLITLREINNPKELKFRKKTKPTKKKTATATTATTTKTNKNNKEIIFMLMPIFI